MLRSPLVRRSRATTSCDVGPAGLSISRTPSIDRDAGCGCGIGARRWRARAAATTAAFELVESRRRCVQPAALRVAAAAPAERDGRARPRAPFERRLTRQRAVGLPLEQRDRDALRARRAAGSPGLRCRRSSRRTVRAAASSKYSTASRLPWCSSIALSSAPVSRTRPMPKLSKICARERGRSRRRSRRCAGRSRTCAPRSGRSGIRRCRWRSPRYRCVAISGVHGTPSASMTLGDHLAARRGGRVEPVHVAVHLVAEVMVDVDDEVARRGRPTSGRRRSLHSSTTTASAGPSARSTDLDLADAGKVRVRRRHRIAIDQAHRLAELLEREGQRQLRADGVAVGPRVRRQDERLALAEGAATRGAADISGRVPRVSGPSGPRGSAGPARLGFAGSGLGSGPLAAARPSRAARARSASSSRMRSIRSWCSTLSSNSKRSSGTRRSRTRLPIWRRRNGVARSRARCRLLARLARRRDACSRRARAAGRATPSRA